MKPQTVIFIGPQGSGKGTQVQNVIKHLHASGSQQPIVDLQTGRGFRALRQQESYTATRVLDLIDNGELVPDFITNAFVVDQLQSELTEDGHLLMDGFPRNLAQARFVDDLLAFYMREDLSVVYLDTDEAVVRDRMKSRGRADDTDESIDERLRLYREMTEPLVDHYKNRPNTNFITVDGALPINDVSAAIVAGLKL